MARGKFITFEGGEGCGKTTQLARLASRLESEGIEVVSVREPGGTALCERIRYLLKDYREDAPCDKSELLLFLAARAQLVKEVIEPSLNSGKWVLSDRFSDSTIAYQGYGRNLDMDFLLSANDFATGGLKSDLTLFFDVEAHVARSRRRLREEATSTGADRIEQAGDAFHLRLAEGFRKIAAGDPQRVKTVDANGSLDEVWEQVWKLVQPIR